MTIAASVTLPPITTVPSLSTTERADILDTLFESSTQLHTLSISTLHDTTYESYPALITAVGEQLRTLLDSKLASDQEWLEKILSAHPRLGAKKPESLSAASQAEQRASTGTMEETELLRTLNEEYEATFPGLRYVVFVNARPRTVIMDDMRQRIARNDMDQEKREAIQAMCDIASDRARKLSGV